MKVWNLKNFYNSSSSYLSAYFFAQLALALIFYFVLWEKETRPMDMGNVFNLGLPAFVLVCLLASHFISKKLIERARSNQTLTAKLVAYQKASIVRYTLVEASTILTLVGAIMTNDLQFFYMAVVLILFFLTLRPTRDKVQRELALSPEESRLFD